MAESTGAATLITELETAGVQLWEEQSRLHYRAPKGVMTQERLVQLRNCKLEVLAELRTSVGRAEVQAHPQERFMPFPLTDVQYAYLTGRSSTLPDGGVGCHGYGELRFEDLDPARLESAWQALISRHDMLRMVAHRDGSQEVQAETPPYRIRVTDLGREDDAAVPAAIEATRAEMDHRVYQAEEWPLFDLRVTRAREFSILHFSLDFLIADFISIQILLDELDQLYADPTCPLPPLSITFRDFLLADRARHSGRQAERDRSYWRSRIADLPEAPDLPLRAHRTSIPRFSRWQLDLPEASWRFLRERARAASLTPSGVVLAAFAEVIGGWSRKQQFTLNLTMLNRPPIHPDVGRIVGDFTAVELLAVDLDPDVTFEDHAQALQARLWADMDHGLYSGIDVMRELRQRLGGGLAVLFPVVFTSSVGVQRGPGEEPAGGPGEPPPGGGLSRLVGGISQTPQVWLDCQVADRAGGLSINWDVRAGIFPDGLIDAMFTAFADLLNRLAAGEGWDVSRPVALPADQRARRAVANDTRAPLSDALLHEAFFAQARRQPDRPAVAAPGRTLSYGQLAAHSTAVALAIADGGGVPGDVIAVEMDKGWEQVAAVLGVLMAGCAYVPIDTNQPRARRDRILADVGAVQVLTQSWLPDASRAGRPSTPVDSLDPVEPPAWPRLAAPDDLAYIIYTSGSTGDPKGVKISHRGAWNTIADINRRFRVGAQDSVLGLASLGFDLSVYDVFGLLSVGGLVVVPDSARRRDPSHWADLIAAHGITIWNSVPAQLEMMLSFLPSGPGPQVSSLRLALLSGDWIPITLPGQAHARMPGITLISLGGATEASIWSILYPIGPLSDDLASIPYGQPLANQSFHVLDTSLRPVPDLVPGELYIGGTGLALGYFGDEAKTAERFIVHPETAERLYRTGDLGYYLQDGNIAFLGRTDSQVKVRGYRVELAEIEAAMLGHGAVAGAAAVALREPPAPSRLVAFAEARGGAAAAAGTLTAPRLAELASAAAAELRSGVDDAQMIAFARELDQAALIQMLAALRENGLFAEPGQSHSLDQILTQARVSRMHQRLVSRWLAALSKNGLLQHDEDSGRYHDAAAADSSSVEAAWQRAYACQPAAEQRSELISYFRLAGQHLSELLRGDLDPVTLLFPEGRTDIHEVAYSGMFLSRYLNKLLTAAAAEVVAPGQDRNPVKVLEVGAGVGGTSIELIPALADLNVEYLFTDVSQFFLNNARKRFQDWPWVDYALFDMNRDYRSQGLVPNSYGLIVCANVLHYARNAADTLARLRELLTPGGWLLFIEATQDNYQIMTSMEFLFDDGSGDFTDVRAGASQTFLTRPQWLELLGGAGADSFVQLPQQDPIVEQMGIEVFAARFKSDRERVTSADLRSHLESALPDYMVPADIQVVDRLPLTANGKVDRGALRSWLPARPGTVAAVGDAPASEFERALSQIWGRLLRVEHVGRDQDFFSLGGDSLLAAQLVTDMRADLPEAAELTFDDLLQQVLGGPTVASLAAGMTAGREPAADPGPARAAGSAVIWLAGEAASGPVDVFVHDATGTLAAYRPLLDRLGDGRALGLAVPDAGAYLGLDAGVLVERVATEYVRELRGLAGTPIRLIGQHFGGIIAVEVARQLAESGVPVEQLVVIASPPIPGRPGDESLAGAAPGEDPVEGDELFRHSMLASAQYEPQSYAGSVTLLLPSPPGSWPAMQADMTVFWQKACLGELDTHLVPGDYFSWLQLGAGAVADWLGGVAELPSS